MGSRIKKIMQLARNSGSSLVQKSQDSVENIQCNQIAKENETVDHGNGNTIVSSCCNELNESVPSTSYKCFTDTNEPLKLNIRCTKKSYKEVKNNFDDSFSDFSSGSSDNYVPSSSPSSTSSEHFENNAENIDSEADLQTDTSENKENMTNTPVVKKGKKRVRCVETWVKEKQKKLKNSGKSYTSKSGKMIKEREIKPPCPDKCILSCSKKVSDETRSRIFQEFWELASLQRQRDFLSSCIEQLMLKYRRITSGQPRRPNCSFYLHIDGKKIRVCKTFLINTLGICERTLRTVIQAKVTGTGIIPQDRRGKHEHHKKINEEVKKSVVEHINSIPRIESHYVRKCTTREFIDGGLSIAELYRNYSKERADANKTAASYDMYSRIFNADFNIGFFVPKKDQCDLCESYKNAIGEDKEKLEDKYKEHQEEKILSRNELNMDSQRAKNSEVALAIYDLQAVLPVPMGDTSSFFYKSRLNCYNFTITDIGKDRTRCYFWHEGLGHRGVTEIGTAIFMFLEDLAASNPGSNVVFYSDNCGGQQKNRYLIGMYMYAVEYLNINSITHKYLVRGHTQNQGDCVHSIIERSMKKAKKSGPIYVPDQIVSVIRSAKKTGNPLEVREMSTEDFYDLKALYDAIALNISKNVIGDDFKISEVRLLQFEKGSNIFKYKTSYKQLEWSCVDTQPKTRRSLNAKKLKDINLQRAYQGNIVLPDKKKKDLKDLIDGNKIPRFYKYFYDSLGC